MASLRHPLPHHRHLPYPTPTHTHPTPHAPTHPHHPPPPPVVESCLLSASVYGNATSIATAFATWFPAGASALSPSGWTLVENEPDDEATPRFIVVGNAVEERVAVVFRGTSTTDEWLQNADIWRETAVLQAAATFTPIAFFSDAVLRAAIYMVRGDVICVVVLLIVRREM